MKIRLTAASSVTAWSRSGGNPVTEMVLKMPLTRLVSGPITVEVAWVAYRKFSVRFDGEDLTSDRNERVLTSLVKEGIDRNLLNIPAGGVGPS